MREPSLPRRVAGTIAAMLAAGVLVSPAAVAQDDDAWKGSRFTAPSGDVVTTSSFSVSGTFVHDEDPIVSVEVDFGRLDGDVYDPADGDPCVPDDPGVVPDTPGNGLETYEFAVSGGDELEWPCNGRYLLRARATSQGLPDRDEHQIARVVEIAVAPPAVQGVEATAEGEVVTVRWNPVDGGAPDAIGYRVERAGPKADGGFGPFVAVGDDVGTEAESARDRPQVSGEYRYRVRALRRGAAAPVPSPAEGSAVADVGVTVATTTTTEPPSDDGPAIPGIGGRSGAPRIPRSSGGPSLPTPSAGPPTTLDTGFESEIDYGDRPLEEEEDREPGELADAGEGQAIIRTEGDGAGLVAPAAGALVLLGWAGHVVYLNRLAKQF